MRKMIVSIILLFAGCSSQPRFTHHGGDPEQMFDNKTAQECWAGPVQKDTGMQAITDANNLIQELNNRMQDASSKYGDACYRALEKYPNGVGAAHNRPVECSETDEINREVLAAMNSMTQASDRADHLRKHPEQQTVVHVRGLPYCSDLK